MSATLGTSGVRGDDGWSEAVGAASGSWLILGSSCWARVGRYQYLSNHSTYQCSGPTVAPPCVRRRDGGCGVVPKLGARERTALAPVRQRLLLAFRIFVCTRPCAADVIAPREAEAWKMQVYGKRLSQRRWSIEENSAISVAGRRCRKRRNVHIRM